MAAGVSAAKVEGLVQAIQIESWAFDGQSVTGFLIDKVKFEFEAEVDRT
jgi:hypothetical protein